MATGRIRRRATRGAVALVLGWLAVLLGSVLFAPGAHAASHVDFPIRDLTPPLVSVDAGGTVTFTNEIADKPVQVGGGGLVPSLVTVVVHTDVTLTLPSGQHPLQPGQAVTEKFASTCATCSITYTYRGSVPNSSLVGSALNTVVGKAVATLPQSQPVTYDGTQTTVMIGVPAPFVVNTLVPLPNLPSVNLPKLPAVTVPSIVPQPPVSPAPVPAPPGANAQPQPVPNGSPQPAPTQRVDGPTYAYDTGAGAPRMAPSGDGASAFDPARVGNGSGSSDSSVPGGAGGLPGSYDGASVPVFGQLSGLDNHQLDASGANAPGTASETRQTLPVAALVAVVTMAGATAALVRLHRLSRAGR